LLKSCSKSERLKEIAVLKCHFKQKGKKKLTAFLKTSVRASLEASKTAFQIKAA